MRKLTKIILHHSASKWGDSAVIDEWHRERGWDGCGYHYVILNGRIIPKHAIEGIIVLNKDGALECPRPWSIAGIHCKGHNRYSIGICFIGETFGDISAAQIRQAVSICQQFPDLKVYGHGELDKKKPLCPGINMDWFRRLLEPRVNARN